MLSISKVSSNQAINYYSSDNYYTKDQGIEQSEWWGEGCNILGLKGQIHAKQFENLLQAKTPDGSEPLLNRKNVNKRHSLRAGTDLTFSAPKSVTLASLVDERLLEAHKKAVDSALEVAQVEFTTARIGKERNIIKSQNMAVAKFHHDTSRKTSLDQHPDPQMHTHCVVLNLTQTDVTVKKDKSTFTTQKAKKKTPETKKKWMAIHNDGYFNNSKLLGLVYQNELAKEAVKLGYDIQINANGTFDLKGYSREQIEAFSKRTAQIKELQATSKKEERSLKLKQRHAKGTNLFRDDLKDFWLDECKKMGIEHPTPKPNEQIEKFQTVEPKAVQSAVAHLGERDVSIAHRRLLVHALEHNIGGIESYGSLTKQVGATPGLITYGVDSGGNVRYTTQAAVDQELKIIKLVASGKGRFEAIANDSELSAIFASKNESNQFTKGQSDALKLASTTRDMAIVWQGVAGSGKSYALHDFRLLAESKGHKVVGLAPDADSAKVLKESAGIVDSTTVASYLNRSADSKDTDSHSFSTPEMPRDIIIVDEAGKLNAREMLELLQKAEEKQNQVILVGDTRQFSAVEAGNPFRLLQQKGIQIAYLTEHRRQKHSLLKAAVEAISEGRGADGLKMLSSKVTELKRLSSRIEHVVNDYMKMPQSERDKTLIMAGTNKERWKLIDRIRTELRSEGSLGQQKQNVNSFIRKNLTNEQTDLATSYQIGDYLIASANIKSEAIFKRTPYEIVAIDGKALTLKAENCEPIQVNPRDIKKKAVFEKVTFDVSQGDKMKWTLNDKDLKRINGQEFQITSLSPDGFASITYQDGKKEKINLNQTQHIDHAVVTTAFSSQGKTSDQVLISTDDTMARESIYVALSRAKYDVKIYTENFEKTLANAERSQAKNSAMDLIKMETDEETKLRPLTESAKIEKSTMIKTASEQLKRNEPFSALETLGDRIKQSKDPYAALAKRYVEFSPVVRSETLILATDQKEISLINTAIRKELYAKNELTGITRTAFLDPKIKDAQPEKSDILIPKKGSSFYKLRKHSQYEVQALHKHLIQLKTPSGQKILVNKNEIEFELFTKKTTSLASGDRIENFQKKKGTDIPGKIEAIDNRKLTVLYDNGSRETVSLDSKKALPFRHSYASLPDSKKAEAKTRVIFATQPKILSNTFQKVLELANDDIEIFTTNSKGLKDRLAYFQAQYSILEKDKSITPSKNLSVPKENSSVGLNFSSN